VAVYLCRKDKYDLTALVKRALVDQGGDVANFDVLVEGRSEEGGIQIEQSTLADLARANDDVTPIIVNCPKDDVPNLFYVARGK
jgi:hypothetical protein